MKAAQHTPTNWEVMPLTDGLRQVYVIARFVGEHTQFLGWNGKQKAHPDHFQTRAAAVAVLSKATA